MDSIEKILSTVRHQFGNTVTALQITSAVLNEKYDSFGESKKKEYIQRILKIAEQQRAMIDALKSYSIIDAKDTMTMAFAEAYELFQELTQAKCKGSKIRVTSFPDPPLRWIQGSPLALRKVAEAVLENAVEALSGRRLPEIKLEFGECGREVCLRIVDNGVGIEESDMDKVGLPLFSTKKGKPGMGLAIAQKLIRELTGRIEIDSVHGSGTTVQIWLNTVAGA